MADVVLKIVVENLLAKIKENWDLITGVWKEADDLQTEVRRLKAFQHDAAKDRQSNSEQWKLLVKEVQAIVYQAEDAVDKLLLNEQLKRKSPFFRAFDIPKYGNNLRVYAKEIKAIVDKTKKMQNENQEAFSKKPILDYQERTNAIGQGSQDTLFEENEVVGFDEEARKLIERLVKGTNKLDVIPVVGLPGLGKTTLATKIYNDHEIYRDFFTRVWVHVGRDYKRKEVVLNILKTYKRITEDLRNMNENELLEIIRGCISSGGKCLIVLDNVWVPDVEDLVRKAFPKDNNKCHRILITTRERRVGRYASDDPHYLKFLENEESFQLLEKRVFGSNRRCPEEFAAQATSIAEKCGGLPLAVVVVAGALKGRTYQSEWQMISDNVPQHLINKEEPESCLRVVEMSYDHLAEEMKPCFLYCAAFPRGFEIPAWRLIRLWIAEGLINSKLKGTLEDIAEYYLNDLVNRNLVMVMEKRADGQVKTCRLHDMLHQFCKVEAETEGLVQEVSEKPCLNLSGTSRRLCIQLSLLKDFFSKEGKHFSSSRKRKDSFSKGRNYIFSQEENVEHVRSFLCFFKKQKGNVDLDIIPPFPDATPLIRVLDIEPFNYFFTKKFSNLVYLRYVAVSSKTAESLPMIFGEFQNLETLIFNTEKRAIDVKVDIWSMLKLTHLHTNVPAKLPSPKETRCEGSSLLQTLSRVEPGSCREDVFKRACNLKKVCIQGKMDELFETNKGGFNHFENLKCLKKLKLLNVSGSSNNNVLQLRIPPTFLKFLSKLKKLTLSQTKFAWSDANRLGELECLEILKLNENAFSGMTSSEKTWDSAGFRELKVLWIKRADFETWTASNSAFRTLMRLVLKSCRALEAVPFEFAGVSSLQEMTLESTEKASVSAQAIEARKKQIAAESEVQKSFKFKLTISSN